MGFLLENKNTYKEKWMHEGHLTSVAYPFIVVRLGIDHDFLTPEEQKQDWAKVQYEISTVFGAGSEFTSGGYIQSAEIDGYVRLARTARIELIDPEGIWPQRLSKIIAISNSYWGGNRGPNIRISFGWENVRVVGSARDEINGILTSTEQDIGEDGVFRFTLNVQEYTFSMNKSFRFINMDDMINSHPDELVSNIENVEKGTTARNDRGRGAPATVSAKVRPQDILTYICDWRNEDKFSVAKQLKEKNIRYIFAGNTKTEPIDIESYPRVRFGEFLEDFIDGIISRIALTEEAMNKAKDQNRSYEYRITKQEEQVAHGEYRGMGNKVNIVYWDWDYTPEVNGEYDIESDPSLIQGPTLLWKSDGNYDYTKKQLLGWSSDLSSTTHLFQQFKDELSEKISNFDDEDWERLQDFLHNNKQMSELDRQKVLDKQTGFLPGLFNKGNKQDWEDAQSLYELLDDTFPDGEFYSGQSVGKIEPLRSILLRNTFTATATVLGDPAFTTSLQGGKTILTTSFRDQTGFSSAAFDDRKWLLRKMTHKIAPGTFTTDLDMVTVMRTEGDPQETDIYRWGVSGAPRPQTEATVSNGRIEGSGDVK